MNTKRKEVLTHFVPQQGPTAQLKVYWIGDSILLKRVIRELESSLFTVPHIRGLQIHSLGDGFIIHDGTPPPELLKNFTLDFNIHDYGSESVTISGRLMERISSGLV